MVYFLPQTFYNLNSDLSELLYICFDVTNKRVLDHKNCVKLFYNRLTFYLHNFIET